MADEPLPEADRVPGHPHPRETRALFGQDAAERHFLEAWAADRMHHAWLLRGFRGVGKATFAYRVARALIARPVEGSGLFDGEPEIPATLDPAEKCPVARRIAAQSEPRLFVIRREANDQGRLQTQIAVDRVRAMRSFLQLSSADGGWRAVIVDPADDMNPSAANALLKYLEEPPANTVFLLVAHAPAGLLPTIRSRCRTLDLAPLGSEDLAKALAATGADVDPAEWTALAELSGGSVGSALRLVAGDGLERYRGIVAAMGGGRAIDRPAMLALADAVGGRDAAERYRMVIELVLLLVARLARAAGSGALPPAAAPDEAALMAVAAAHRAQAAPWAEALAELSARTRHAVAVNLDPTQVVMDMFLELDAILAEVRKVAA